MIPVPQNLLKVGRGCPHPAVPNMVARGCPQPAAFIFLSLLGLAIFSGCAGYRLGPSGGFAAREKSIQIHPFLNQTTEPRLTDAVSFQLRKEIQRDGTYQLSTHGDADIFVSGVITNYNRHALSYDRTDTLTARDYRLSITAMVTARERSTGKTLLDQSVTGYTLIRVGSDITSTERQALPLLAQDLAKNVTSLLADGSW